MKTVYAPSLSLPKGVPCSVFESIEELETQAGVKGKTLELANLYLRQKGCLVDGRDFLATAILEKSKFPPKTKNVEVKDKEGKVTGTKEEWTETEGEYIKRFRAALAKKEIRVTGVTGEGEALINAGLAWEQSLLDAHGPFVADAKAAERTGKTKTPPQYALNAAKSIIGNKSENKWIATFKKEGIEHGDFVGGDEASNITALAWAVKARQDAKAMKEYV